MDRTRPLVIAAIVLLGLLAVSGVRPYDRLTWLMEVAPVLITLPVLWTTWRRFPLTTLLYACIFVHAVVLIVGGAYTYARVPFGFWLQELLGLDRNPYDRIGHLFQGLVPALVTREILLRGGYVQGKKMLAFLVGCVVLAVSAMYELIEWAVADVFFPAQGAAYLGSQGDIWDAQKDMGLAFSGAVLAMLMFSTAKRMVR